MPILKKEIDVFPANLLEDSELLEDENRHWWALYTMSRQEKELMRRLVKQQIAFYAPIIPREYRSPAGRLRTSYIPLFSNYVFINGSDEDRYNAVATGCVSRCLEVVEGEQLATDLRQVQMLINGGTDLTPEAQILPGDVVRVRSGSMAGLIGQVVERRGEKRLLVAVNFLQAGASVELRDVDVEPYTP